MQLSDYKPGQTVYLGNGQKAVVEKVGRKYVTLEGSYKRRFYVYQYERECLVEDCEYGSPEKLYPDEEAYQNAVLRQYLEKKLSRQFGWDKIREVTLEKLKLINAILEEKT